LFEQNLKLVGDDARVSILNKDFVDVDYGAIGKFNVLFYDGSHSEEHQYLGVKLPSQALDPQAIVMVDDWNWEQVRRGTYAGLRDAGRTILCSLEIRTTLHNRDDLPPFAGSQSDWHNGLFVALTQAR
jgi:hypothetical protein